MITPEGIPPIPGDMAALAGHASALSEVGAEFAATGARVNSTWQGLAGVYDAPEVGTLLAATAPVQSISASVGEDLGAAGRALSAYATEVAEIQSQLSALRTQAGEFVASVHGDDDWTSDGGKVDRNRELLEAVNAQMAAFFEAQRRCANTINALYGGQQYTAENGDGQVEPGEYGYTAEQLNAAAAAEGALPWGHAEQQDRGFWGDVGAFFGGIKDGAVQMVTDLGALIGRDPTTGEWSWSTAGAAWKGMGTFALAVGVYSLPGGALLDQAGALPGMERGQLGDTLIAAGKGLIAYDQWGQDPARAAGTTTFNVVSAILGTKGAGAGLRGIGAAAQGSRVAVVSTAGTALIRTGQFIGRLPTVDDLVARTAARLPGFHLPDLSGASRVDIPHHVDIPTRPDLPTSHLNPLSGTRTPKLTPDSVGDALSGTPDPPPRKPSTPEADVFASRSVDATPTTGDANTPDASSVPSDDRTPALVGAHYGDSPRAEHASTGSGTDSTPPPDSSGPGSGRHESPDDGPDTPHGGGQADTTLDAHRDEPGGSTPHNGSDHDVAEQRAELSRPSASEADVPRSVDTARTPNEVGASDPPNVPSDDRTPALVGAHHDNPARAEHASTGSGTDSTPPGDGSGPGSGHHGSPHEGPTTSHGGGQADTTFDAHRDEPGGSTPHDGSDRGDATPADGPAEADGAAEHRGSTDHMPAPEPGNRSLEVLPESRVERGADGLVDMVDGRPVGDYLRDVAEQRAEQFREGRLKEEFSRRKVGNVSSVALDRRTGELFEGTNGFSDDRIAPDNVHPLLRQRLDELEAAGPYPAANKDGSLGPGTQPHPHPDDPLGHAEIRAVNELLWRRGGEVGPEVFGELRVDNYFPFLVDGVRSAPCCANCAALLAGTPSNAGRFTGYPPGSHNFLPE